MVSEILTLQELSIKVVIDEFSWYTAAHKSTNSERFKKNLLFLQRVYSYSIFQELDRNGKLNDEHLDFLLNAYLRKLDVGSLLSLTSKENVVQKVIPIAHSLTELSCYKEYNMRDCLYTLREVLPHAVNLTSLDFSLCDDISLPSHLLKMCSEICPKVRKLALPISKDEELELCCLFSNLEDISILHDTFSTINLNNFLEAIGKQLKCLTVSSFGLLSVSTLIDNCANLETLALENVEYQERDPKTTKTLTHLHTLQLDSIVFIDFVDNSTESVIALLNSSPNLKKLSLLYCDISESDMVEKLSAYSNNCKLKHLSFDYSEVEVDLLHHFVSNCTSLTSLSLVKCENLSVHDIAMLNHNIQASNRKIEIHFLEDEDFISSYSNEINHDADFDDGEDYDDDDDDDDFEMYRRHVEMYLSQRIKKIIQI